MLNLEQLNQIKALNEVKIGQLTPEQLEKHLEACSYWSDEDYAEFYRWLASNK